MFYKLIFSLSLIFCFFNASAGKEFAVFGRALLSTYSGISRISKTAFNPPVLRTSVLPIMSQNRQLFSSGMSSVRKEFALVKIPEIEIASSIVEYGFYQCDEEGTEEEREIPANSEHFVEGADYVSVYDKGVSLFTSYLAFCRMHAAMMPKGPVRILDAGGGTGNIALTIMQENKEAEVHLLDLNKAMVKFAIKKGFPEDRTHIASITDMKKNTGEPFLESSFDGVVVNNVLYILTSEEVEKAFQALARILKPGGVLSISGPRKKTTKEEKYMYIQHLKEILNESVRAGKVTRDVSLKFLEANRELIARLNSPMEEKDLIAIARRHGFLLMIALEAHNEMSHFVIFERISSRKIADSEEPFIEAPGE